MAHSSADSQSPPRIAIAGNPNSGKTTLFNALTGLRHKVANYPGVTVEKREGVLIDSNVILLDLPGTYSLSARSPDEVIARDILQGRVTGTPRPDGILLVVDASNLERNLYLATQILDFGTPVVIACNMMDVAKQAGLQVDCAALSRELGVPVVPIVASRGIGLDQLRETIQSLPSSGHKPRPWALSPAFESAVQTIARQLSDSKAIPPHTVEAGALLWLMDYLSEESAARASAERFLARLPNPAAQALCVAARQLKEQDPDAAASAIEARYRWISQLAQRIITKQATPQNISWTDRIDAVLTHRVLGLLSFTAIMLLLFLSIFSWAEPLMDALDLARRTLAGFVHAKLNPGPIRSLLADGIITGVGAVVGFFPQICILFLCLGFLEDTGYLARAAFIIDRMMSRFGLHGQSFIPLLSCHACAIPGILATRTIADRRDRFTTILVAPLISCSARIPIYLIIIAAVFGERLWVKTFVMFGLYSLGIMTALLAALVFKKTLFAGPRPPFIMELPPYHLPRPWVLLRSTWDRAKSFLTNAGTIIFAVCIVIWALSYFPHHAENELPPAAQQRINALRETGQLKEAENVLASQQLQSSWMGRMGQLIEPAIRPLGYDWRFGIGILSSFLAREVFVGTMGITFAVGNPDDESEALRDQLANATWPDGQPILTRSAGLSLLIFYVLACQCISTLAVIKKETGSWKWPTLAFVYMSALAYLAALTVNQVGSHWPPA